MPGPPRTPKKILEMRGSWLAKKRQNEPEPTAGIPEPPGHLSEEVRVIYYDFAKIINEMQVLTLADKAGLMALAETYKERIRAQAVIDKQGLTLKEKKEWGWVYYKNPMVPILQDADRRLRFWLCEFGLTPASRTRVKLNARDKGKEHPAAKYLA